MISQGNDDFATVVYAGTKKHMAVRKEKVERQSSQNGECCAGFAGQRGSARCSRALLRNSALTAL